MISTLIDKNIISKFKKSSILISEQELKTPKVFFNNLNTLRFFAFFAVFIGHSFSHYNFPKETTSGKLITALITMNDQSGALGVKFFFVLSGFLITYLIFSEKNKNNGKLDVQAFYMRRLLRIWPLYYAAILIGFFIYPTVLSHFTNTLPKETANAFNFIFFLGNFDMIWNGYPTGKPLNVLWSLSVEEQFYLFWPILFLILGKVNRYNYLLTFGTLILISVAFQFYHHSDNHINYFHSVSCFGSLISGGLLAYLSIYSKPFIIQIQNLNKWVIRGTYLTGFFLILFVSLVPNSYIFTLYQIIIALFFGFVILEQNFALNSFFKFGKLRFLSYLGKISYGLYILHPLAIFITDRIFEERKFTYPQFAINIFSSFTIAVLLAYVSYNFFEKPFLQLKTKFEK